MLENENIRAALAASSDDRIVFDLAGIEATVRPLRRRTAGRLRPVRDEGLPGGRGARLPGGQGAGFDAASPNEIVQAISTGVPIGRMHYGNTIKSDWNIADAYRSGVRDFATDSVEDVTAIAAHAPGARVFCRLATSGDGALWGLSEKFGCSADGRRTRPGNGAGTRDCTRPVCPCTSARSR